MNTNFLNWLDEQTGAFVTEDDVQEHFPNLRYNYRQIVWTWNTNGDVQATKSDWRAAHRTGARGE